MYINHDVFKKGGLILLRGLPGSGKTTLAQKVTRDLASRNVRSKICEADHYFTDADGNYKFDGSELPKAHAECLATARQCMKSGGVAIVANTNVECKHMQPYIDVAESLELPYMVIVTSYPSKSIHNVPEHTLMRMKKRWESFPGDIEFMH